MIERDLTKSDIATWMGAAIDGVAPDGAGGGALVVITPISEPGVRVERVAPSASGYATTVVRRQPHVAAAYFSRRGETVLLHEVSWDPKASFLSNPPQRIVISTDGGNSWSVDDVTADAIDSVCLVDNGFWTLLTRTQRLVFKPLPKARAERPGQ